jgi:hypothetical protein
MERGRGREDNIEMIARQERSSREKGEQLPQP